MEEQINSVTSIEQTEGVATPEDNSNGTSEVNNDTANPNPSEQPAEQNGTQRNFAAEIGKMSSLEKRANQAEKKLLDVYSKQLENKNYQALNSVFIEDKQSFESFRKHHLKQTGQDLGDWDSLYGQAAVQPVPQVNQQPQDVQSIVKREIEAYKQESEQKQQINDAYQSLISNVPELNQIYNEDKDKAMDLAEKSIRLAESLSQVYNKPLTESIVDAFYALPENRNKQMQAAKQTGEIIGQAQAYNKGVASNAGVSIAASQGPAKDYTAKIAALSKNPVQYASYMRKVNNLGVDRANEIQFNN